MRKMVIRNRSRRGRKLHMSKFQKQVNDLLKQAMQRPGVAEAMRVYQAQQPARDAYAQMRDAVAPRWVVSVSTSTKRTA